MIDQLNRRKRIYIFLATLCSILPNHVLAQPAPAAYVDTDITRSETTIVPESTKSAVLDAYKDAASQMGWHQKDELVVAAVNPFYIPDGTAVQVHIGSYQLGPGSYLFISSADRTVFQRLGRTDLENYGDKSAFFPSGKLTISTLHPTNTPPPDVELKKLRILHHQETVVYRLPLPKNVRELRAPVAPADISPAETLESAPPESLCFPDDRQPSSDRRVGRIMPVGCTGWLIQEDIALSAGHCHAGDKMDIIEFQVPASDSRGRTTPAHPNNQYPVLQATIMAENSGVGHDWAVFRIGPNSNTGKLPGQAQGGFFQLSQSSRPDRIRVTGYGIDNTPTGATGNRNRDNQTQQTDDGGNTPTVTYYDHSGNGSYFRYTVDTTGGNSGSPVIEMINGCQGAAVAIHSHAGCESGGNHGTAVNNADLRQAIASLVGDLSRVYLDANTEDLAHSGYFPDLARNATETSKAPSIREAYPEWLQKRIAARNHQALRLFPKSVRENSLLWPNNRSITVAFNGGNEKARGEIEDAANEWTRHANIEFDFRDSAGLFRTWSSDDRTFKADIRISFERDGYWSTVGTDSRNPRVIYPNEASMNLEKMENGSLSRDQRGTVIHEFGHALGFHHEHQTPVDGCDLEFRWESDAFYVPTLDRGGHFIVDACGRRPGVYTVMGGAPNHWSRSTVDFNLRQLEDSDAYEATAHDPNSIMHYDFESWMFFDGAASRCFTSRNDDLSPLDIEGVKKAYPPLPAELLEFQEPKDAQNLKGLYWIPTEFPRSRALDPNSEARTLPDSGLPSEASEFISSIGAELIRRHDRTNLEKLGGNQSAFLDGSQPNALSTISGHHLIAPTEETVDRQISNQSTTALLSVQQVRLKRVYGNDDRRDMSSLAKERETLVLLGASTVALDAKLKNARAVACVVSANKITSIPGKNQSLVRSTTYGVDPLVCTTERFHGQPVVSDCTAFFVGKDLLMTAGHCVQSATISDQFFLFDFNDGSSADPNGYLVVNNSDLYRGVKILGRSFDPLDPNAPDWALVKVDREITDRESVSIAQPSAIGQYTKLYVMGHPSGLPLKHADNAHVTNNQGATSFSANLDTYGGNSGSPVFNESTHQVEGILVRGGRDFRLLSLDGSTCYQTVFVGNGEGPGETVTRVSEFTTVLNRHLQ